MKHGILTGIMMSCCLQSPALLAGEYSVGIGVGHLYSGIGINLTKHLNRSQVYASLGCMAAATHSGSNDIETVCGMGLGYVSTHLFSQSDKHGIGLSTGVYRNTDADENEYTLGPTYTFYANGINNRGWSIGVMPYMSKVSGRDAEYEVLFNFGYQL
ncbi:MAG: hypothetical protein ABW076_09145 [Candidatus Thiodiazotropha sp.]